MIDVLAKLFELKELSPMNTFFGIQIICNRPNQKIYFDQDEYIKKILEKFNYIKFFNVKTLWPANIKFIRK